MSNPLKKLNDERIDVDLCFVCDCTNTMESFIQKVLDDISNFVATVSSKLKAKLRVAFVAYRDYPSNDSANPESRVECYDFTSDLNQFINFLSVIPINGGGGDRCEDVLGGLHASLSLKWTSPTKVLFHICDDPAHGIQYHSFYDEIEENRLQLMEFINFDSETCKDIFGRDSWEFLWIFQHDDATKRQEALTEYIKSRKTERDRFPNKHENDPDHNDILLTMKNKGIQYYIAKKTQNVNKMIDVFKRSGANIDYNVDTCELTAASQLFGAIYHSISTAITISKEVKHTQLIQQRARRLFLDSKQNKIGHIFKVYCGIDFGTDGTAFSYCLPGDDEVYTPNWGGDDRVVDTKLKTNILLDSKSLQCVAFGQRAKEMYMSFEVEEDSSSDSDDESADKQRRVDMLFFERFKMALYKLSKKNDEKKENEDIKEQLVSISGRTCKSTTVIIEALKFVKRNAVNVMNKAGLKVTVEDCQWVLTVPAIWSNRSKGIMIHCAEKAGLINPEIPNHLIIAFEPDCASIAIQHEYMTQRKQKLKKITKKVIARRNSVRGSNLFANAINDEKSDNDDSDDADWLTVNISNVKNDDEKKEQTNKKSLFNERKKFFNRGEKYILADLGGGTADIACHEILSAYNVREIYRPSGGPYGSTYIDVEFIKLLGQVISKRWMKEFKSVEPHKYVELVNFFQQSKKHFWQKRNIDGSIDDNVKVSDYCNVKLPFEFIQFLDEKIEVIADEYDDDNEIQKTETLFNNYSNSFIEKGWMILEDQHLKMHNKIWEYLFDTVINSICNHIKDLIKNLSVAHKFQYLLLAGGFCESKYVRYKLLKTFGMATEYKLRIVIPRRPLLQVVTGAALYCKNQCYVKSRVLRNSIGIEIRQSLNDFEDKYNEYIAMKNNNNIEDEEKKDEILQIYDDGISLLNRYENDKYIKDKIVEDKHLMKKYIDCVFHKFVSFGDEIQIDEPPKIQYFKPIDKDSKCIEIKIFEFEEDEKEGLFTDDNKCTLVAEKKIDLPLEWINKNNDSSDIPIAFFFGDTQIKVYIGIQGLNEKDANIHLDYKYYHK